MNRIDEIVLAFGAMFNKQIEDLVLKEAKNRLKLKEKAKCFSKLPASKLELTEWAYFLAAVHDYRKDKIKKAPLIEWKKYFKDPETTSIEIDCSVEGDVTEKENQLLDKCFENLKTKLNMTLETEQVESIKSHPKKKTVGRPRRNKIPDKRRIQLWKEWERARDYTTKAEFCKENNISKQDLDTCRLTYKRNK